MTSRLGMGVAVTMLAMATSAAAATVVTQEPGKGGLRHGQRVLVDDGSCPSGQIKEVIGGFDAKGGERRQRRCIRR